MLFMHCNSLGGETNNNLLAHPINLKITFVRQKCSKKKRIVTETFVYLEFYL